MNWFMTSMIAATALMIPGAALAEHLDPTLVDASATFASFEACEEARAELRRELNTFSGRDQGQFNKEFNAAFQCADTGMTDENGEPVFSFAMS